MIDDAGLRTSLEAAIGHPSPFLAEELAQVKQLSVTGARDLMGLQHCTGLKELTLFGCETTDLSAVPIAGLRTLRLLASTVEDLTFLRGAAGLVELEVNYCLVQNLEPLFSLPALRRVRMIALPLDERSFNELRPRLAKQPLGEGRPPVVAFSSQDEWRVTRRLFDRGLAVCYGTLDGDTLLVRPGIAKGLVKAGEIVYPTDDAVDFAETSDDAIEYGFEIAGANPTTDEYVGAFFMQRSPPARGALRFQSTLLLGDADDARSWLKAARMSDETRERMLRFVDRFAEHGFYRDTPEYFRRLEAAGARYPSWFKLLRTNTLGFAGGDRRAKIRVDKFELQQSPRSQYAESIWYRLSLNPSGDPDTRKLWSERCGAQPIADWPYEYRSALCLSINDLRVFEAAEADLRDAESEGGDPMKSIYTVFSSYGSLLEHIVEVEL